MASIYGQLVKAQLENLASDISSPPTGIVYFNTGSGIVKFYDGSAWRTTVTLDNTQTLTGKTLTAPILTNYGELTEIATPTTPSSGLVRLYAKSDHKVYRKDSTGTETEIGASASTATASSAGVVTSYSPLVQSRVYAGGDASFTIGDSDGYDYYTVAPTSVSRTVTLPVAANNVGKRLTIVNICAPGVITASVVARQSSDVIYDGIAKTSTSTQLGRTLDKKTFIAIASGIWVMETAASDYQSIDLSTDANKGNFSAGTLILERVGNLVTYRFSGITTSSTSAPATNAGIILTALRPQVDLTFCSTVSTSAQQVTGAVIKADGTFQLLYVNDALQANSRTAPGGSVNSAGCYSLT